MKKKSSSRSLLPNRNEEEMLFSSGYRRIAGLDEAGRGALAGPVVAAAVILPQDADFPWLHYVKDSKLMSANTREDVFHMIEESGIETSVGIVSAEMIDSVNILNATRKAMRIALEKLSLAPDYILTDAVLIPRIKIPQKGLIKGDRTCLPIACASIVAKVTRDHIMLELDAAYPQYGFSKHKGYGTQEHLECLQCHGASMIHRLTFSPVKALSRLI